MNISFWIAVILQIVLVMWLLSSLRLRKDDYHFFDNDSTSALKGFFSIVIVLFHVPTSNVLCNLLGCASAVIIVTMFSFFSTYGMTIKVRLNKEYIGMIPYRFVRIAVLYILTLMIKYFITGNMYSGGILWINSLLLSYVVFYVAHLVGGRYCDCIVIAFWIFYAIVMRLYPNNHFGWPAQSFGFAYGCIAAVFVEPLQRFFVKRIKEICVVCVLVLPVLGMIYLRIHTPERESVEMYFIRVAMSLLMVLLFLTLSVRMSIVNRFMMYLGKISLYIYLLHGMMIDLFNGHLTDGWYILVCIITTVLAAACFNLVTEKVLALFRRCGGKTER